MSTYYINFCLILAKEYEAHKLILITACYMIYLKYFPIYFIKKRVDCVGLYFVKKFKIPVCYPLYKKRKICLA